MMLFQIIENYETACGGCFSGVRKSMAELVTNCFLFESDNGSIM